MIRSRIPKQYEVATFYYDDIVGKVLCYLRYRAPQSRGRQIIYTVLAETGRQACRLAKQKRLDDEALRSPEKGADRADDDTIDAWNA